MAVRYGRYEVVCKLGQGAMAQVFLAKDPVLARHVAVKVLHAELAARKDVLQRFFNEARIVAGIRNPHIVEVFDFGKEGGDLYLVMEFVDGLSLHGLMRRAAAPAVPVARGAGPQMAGAERGNPAPSGFPGYEPLDAAVAMALICQAAEGLAIASRQGVVHRDLKPENLLIDGQGYLKISDFGIAHVQDESLTRTGAVLGSPLYMSPEQAAGAKPITSQADMFSLGAVFYACLAGQPPFQGRTVTELFRRIAVEPHAPLARLRPGLDPGLGNLVDTLLAKRPADRGGGPQWLQRHLKAHLMALGIADPAELAAGYLKELRDRGIQTTWKWEARGDARATVPMGATGTQRATAPAMALPVRVATRPDRESAPRSPWAPIALASVCLALGAALGIWGWSAVGNGTGSPGGGAAQAAGATAGPAKAQTQGPGHPGKAGSVGPGKDGTAVPAAAGGSVQDTLAPGDPPPAEDGSRIAAAGSSSSVFPAGSAAGLSSHAIRPGADPAPLGPAGEPGPAADAGNRPPGKDKDAVLILKSSPPFADAYLDGRFVGVTPVRLAALVPGRHRLMMKSGRGPGLDTVLPVAAGIHALRIRLDAGPGLRVAVTPADAE